MIYAGIDVSAKSLAVARVLTDASKSTRSFPNTAQGHAKLIQWLQAPKQPVRVALEATGVYSQAVTWALHGTDGIEVMVANPRAIKHFANACMIRSKTDEVDAAHIALYAQQMAFTPWQPPALAALHLRQISRRIQQLKVQLTSERNRLHVEEHTAINTAIVQRDIALYIDFLTQRISQLQAAALALIAGDAKLASDYQLLMTVKGIADNAAIAILAELACLPTGLTASQWVANAGLDPKACQSGSSIYRPGRISKAGNKHLRTALFLPAMVASTHDQHVGAFKKRLIDKGKKPLQAIVAVMRKLLVAIYAMLKNQAAWQAQLAFPAHTT